MAALALCAACVIGFELRPGRTVVAPLAVRADQPTVRGGSGESAAEAAGLRQSLLARPAFAPGRRPASVTPPAVAVAAPSMPRLIGIVIDGDDRRAIFAPHEGGRSVALAEGGEFSGLKVLAIEPGGVTVTGSGARRVLRPRFEQASIGSEAAAPAPPPSPVTARFNGPPGLDRMPKALPARPDGAAPGLPGLPGVGELTGIPGLAPAR